MKYFTILINLSSLLFFLVWAFDIVREDMNTHKISNKKIVYALKVWLFFLIVSLSISFIGHYEKGISHFNFVFYRMLLINFLFSFSSAIILWYGEIWLA